MGRQSQVRPMFLSDRNYLTLFAHKEIADRYSKNSTFPGVLRLPIGTANAASGTLKRSNKSCAETFQASHGLPKCDPNLIRLALLSLASFRICLLLPHPHAAMKLRPHLHTFLYKVRGLERRHSKSMRSVYSAWTPASHNSGMRA